MVNRQEAMRHKTTEYEAELRTKTELVKTMAEADGRIKQERENHDLILEKVKLEAIEKRDTVLKAIGLDFAVFTGGNIAPGRAISKLAIAWHASTYGTDGAIPDQDTFFKTVEHHKKSMSQKDDWITTERANMLTTDR